MANTATAFYIDTYGSGTKQTGHPEFELSEAINYSPFTVEVWYQQLYLEWTDWSPLVQITDTAMGSSPASGADGDFYLMTQYGGGNNYYAAKGYGSPATGGGDIDSDDYNAGNIIRNNDWHHFAFTRQYNSWCSIFHDGKLISGGSANTNTRIVPGRRVELGYNRNDAGNYPFKGYMDALRISKVARYGNIDIPTTQLNTWQTAGRGQNALLPHHTKLLIQGTSTTTTSSTIIDQTGRHSVTVNGCVHKNDKTLFGNTAIYFDGTNDYLEIPDSADWDQTQDFSWEAWVSHTDYSGSEDYFFQGNTGANNNYTHFWQESSGIRVNNQDGTGYTFNTGFAPKINDSHWHHVVAARNGNLYSIWVDGKLGVISIDSDTPQTYSQTGLRIGGGGYGGNYFQGYMDGIRVCQGVAAYTPNFVPYGGQKNVAIDRGGAVTDARHPSANTHAIRMRTDPLRANANTYCLDFDGTADYLLHRTPNWRSADDRGTIFAWIYKDDNSGTQDFFTSSDTGSNEHAFIFGIKSTGKMYLQHRVSDVDQVMTSTGTSVALDGWHSIALTSDGDDYKFYYDGAASAFTATSGTDDGDWISAISNRDNVAIGCWCRHNEGVVDMYDGKAMQVAYWGGSSGTTGVLDADAITALHNAGKGYNIKNSGDTGNYDSWSADLRGYWQMGNHYLDSAGNTSIYDASGYGTDMVGVSIPAAKTWTTGTTFLEGWQDRGYFTGDKYTNLLIQSAHANGSTTFTDSGPGFKKTDFDGTNDYLTATVSNYRSSDSLGTVLAWSKFRNSSADATILSSADTATTTHALNLALTAPRYTTGGAIGTYLTYQTHTFYSSGSFVISAGDAIFCDILVIGGGGAGGYGYGGGGGSGGVVWATGQTLGAGTYTVTVGAGQAAHRIDSAPASSQHGANSVFSGTSPATAITISAGYGGVGGTDADEAGIVGAASTAGHTFVTDGGKGGIGGHSSGGDYKAAGSGYFNGTTTFNAGGTGATGRGGFGIDGPSTFVDSLASKTKALLDAAGVGEESGSQRYVAGTGGGAPAWSMFGGASPGGLGGGGDSSGNMNLGAGGGPQAERGSLAGAGGGGQTYGSYDSGAGAPGVVVIRTSSSRKISIKQQNNNGRVDQVTGEGQTADMWNMHTWQSTGTEYKLFTNGTEDSISVPAGLNSGDWFADTTGVTRDNLIIGGLVTSSASGYLTGQIAQVAIWNTQLTAAQISAIYDLGPGVNLTTSYSTGLVDYWAFGNKITEGTDTSSTIYSQVASGQDLTTAGSMAAPYAGHTISMYGSAHHNATKSVFGGSSILFDGTGDYLSLADSTDWDMGNGEFTIELWIQVTSTSNIMIMGQSSSNGIVRCLISSRKFTAYFYDGSNGGAGKRMDTTSDIEVGIWYHVALVRDNTGRDTLRLFLNGIQEETYQSPGTQVTSSAVFTIGNFGTYNSQLFEGYMDEFRISQGIARYTKSIERYANTFVAKGDTGDAYTVFQIQSNGAKSGTVFSDGLNRTGYSTSTGTVSGTPTWINTSGDPFGGANTALFLQGADSLQFPTHSDFNMGNEDFTLECWFYWTVDPGGFSTLFAKDGDDNKFAIGTNASGFQYYIKDGAGTWCRTNSSNNILAPVMLNTWHHLAFVHDTHDALLNWFLDGVFLEAVDAQNGTFNLTADSQEFIIGKHNNANLNYVYTGYIDQIRLSKGIARYGGTTLRTTQQVVTSSNSDSQVVTANSTGGSGTNLFTADAYTAFLLQGDGTGFSGTAGDTFTDESASPGLGAKTVTNNGGIILRQGVSAFGANSYFFDGTNADSLSVPSSTDFSMDGDFTIEMWAKADTAIASQTDLIFSRYGGSPDIGYQVNAFANGSCAFYHGDGSEGWSAITNPNNSFKDGNWHHLATQRKDNTFSIWIDGKGYSRKKNYGTVGRNATDVLYIGNNAGGSEAWHGFMDGIRISKGIARYGYAGTNIKVGTNAVHHSHCKLLITSNTYHANTDFDDFADLGNYWNQAPNNFCADRDMSISTQNAAERNALTTFSFSFWFNPYALTACTLCSALEGADSSDYGTGFRIQLATTGIITITAVACGGPAGAFESTHRLLAGNWHLITYTNSGTSGTDHMKCFIDGQQSATSSTAATATTDINYWYLFSERHNGTTAAYCRGRMSAAAIWNSALTAAEVLELWERGPAQSSAWTNNSPNYSSAGGLIGYYAFGNQDEVGGRPADFKHSGNAELCMFDRSGIGKDCYVYDGTNTFDHGFNKGTNIVRTGGVRHSTEVKNFGSSAMSFDGGSDYLSIPIDVSGAKFGTGAFTVEGWVHPFYKAQHGVMLSAYESNGWIVEIGQNGSGATSTVKWRNQADGDDNHTSAEGTIQINSWHHIAVCRERGAGPRMYVNGSIVGFNFNNRNYGSGMTQDLRLGRYSGTNGTEDFLGYMDEIAIYHTSKYNSVALPGQATITPSYLDDPSGNQFTTSGLAITDQMIDSPENNFCTWNSQHPSASRRSLIAGEGNLQVQGGTAGVWEATFGNMGFTSGKWYYEATHDQFSAGEPRTQVGWGAHDILSKAPQADGDGDQSGDPQAADGYMTDYYVTTSWGAVGYTVGGGSQNQYTTFPTTDLTAPVTVNETEQVCIDLDNNRIWLGHKGIWYGDGPDPSTGTGAHYSADYITGTAANPMRDSSIVGHYTPFMLIRTASSGTEAQPKLTFNFGQGDPDGQNNYTDDEGRGGFRFQPPTGFLSLCTANMKDADYAPIGPGRGTNPDKHFDTLLYSGTSAYGNHVSGLNFQPDLVWLKQRSGPNASHFITDSVRGTDKQLKLDTTAAETTYVNTVESFNADGFTLGDEGNVNTTSRNYIAFCWKAGNGTVENNDGDIQSTVSVNQDAGFSIVKYKATATQDASVGTGLSKPAEFAVIKTRDSVNSWLTYHVSMGFGKTIFMDTNGGIATTDYFGDTDWTSASPSIFRTDTGNSNIGSENFIAYCWHGVEGFSKFGSYRGNGNTDGPFVYLGFKPAFVIIKSTSAGSPYPWSTWNNKSNPYNPVLEIFEFDAAGALNNVSGGMDFLSNGFKLRNSGNYSNTTADYIYMAWAEMPFKYANAR